MTDPNFFTYEEITRYARDLVEDGSNVEYTRGMAELIGELFPVHEQALGDRAQDIIADLVPGRFQTPIERTVTLHPLYEAQDEDPEYRWQCRVHMSWLTDGDGAPREENGHGRTRDEAIAMARRIAAAFMVEPDLPSDVWPANGIDHIGDPS